MSQQLSYFHIDWLSQEDGPGKRAVLFLQGCPLDCLWCHSPHSQHSQSPLLFFERQCIGCQRCAVACPNDVHFFKEQQHTLKRENCIQCGNCVQSCPKSSDYQLANALVLPTQKRSVESLFETLKPQLELLKDNGGITFSGGEPLLQVDSLTELAQMCKNEGFHTALETSGIVPLRSVQKIAPFIDTWLLGIRLTTGTELFPTEYLEKRTKDIFQFLIEQQRQIIVRIPAIPEHTDSMSYLTGVNKIIASYSKQIKVEVLSQNEAGSHYYEASGTTAEITYEEQKASLAYHTIISQLID